MLAQFEALMKLQDLGQEMMRRERVER